MGKIVVKNLCKTYYTPGMPRFEALNNVSFELNKEECVALIGKSGSGKSTIGRILIGLDTPTSGNIYLNGEATEKWTPRQWRTHRREIQAVFQDATGTLNPRLSVEHNVQIAMKNLTKLNRQERKARIIELMELTHMNTRLLKTPTSALSGGEQRRIALLRALSIRPDYLVLDEVTSGLDSVNTRRVLDVLEICLQEYSCGCLLITHDMCAVECLADRIIELSHGEIIGKAVRKHRKEDA